MCASSVFPADNKPNKLHSMLPTVFSKTVPTEERLDRLENEFGITVTEKIRKEVTDMCNLSQGIRNDEKEDTARRMIRAGKYDNKDIMDISGLTLEQIEKIREEEKNKKPVMA